MLNNSHPKYFLGIDWGLKKIGLALADDENLIAFGYSEIDSKDAAGEIKKLLNEFSVKAVILGQVDDLGGYHTNTKMIESFKESLEKMGLLVYYEKENFSSKLAQINLSQRGKSAALKNDNKEAARIILQSWLDRGIDGMIKAQS